jgi:hypothetical protein
MGSKIDLNKKKQFLPGSYPVSQAHNQSLSDSNVPFPISSDTTDVKICNSSIISFMAKNNWK